MKTIYEYCVNNSTIGNILDLTFWSLVKLLLRKNKEDKIQLL